MYRCLIYSLLFFGSVLIASSDVASAQRSFESEYLCKSSITNTYRASLSSDNSRNIVIFRNKEGVVEEYLNIIVNGRGHLGCGVSLYTVKGVDIDYLERNGLNEYSIEELVRKNTHNIFQFKTLLGPSDGVKPRVDIPIFRELLGVSYTTTLKACPFLGDVRLQIDIDRSDDQSGPCYPSGLEAQASPFDSENLDILVLDEYEDILDNTRVVYLQPGAPKSYSIGREYSREISFGTGEGTSFSGGASLNLQLFEVGAERGIELAENISASLGDSFSVEETVGPLNPEICDRWVINTVLRRRLAQVSGPDFGQYESVPFSFTSEVRQEPTALCEEGNANSRWTSLEAYLDDLHIEGFAPASMPDGSNANFFSTDRP